jgi:hypothetical protein
MTCNMDTRQSRNVCWIGEIDRGRSDLGLPVLEDKRTATLYRAEPETGTYSHHGYVTAHRDVLFATWSNHARDEDAPGQLVRFSLSEDRGSTWRPHEVLFPPRDEVKPGEQQDNATDRVLIANGFAVVDETLYAVAEAHVLEERRGVGRLARSVSAGCSPGPIFWLVENPPAPREGFEEYPHAGDPEFSETAAAINEYLARPEHLPSWEFLHQSTRPVAPDGNRLCEPTQCWELEDGTLVRLWRDLSKTTGSQYAQFSFDAGESWNDPAPAEFPDAYSRAAAGTLPDGTAYVINNPGEGRDPLVISLAEDGLYFDRHAVIAQEAPPRRYEGRWKGIGFQYPRATVLEDTLHVIYSVNKEDVRVTGIPLEALHNL